MKKSRQKLLTHTLIILSVFFTTCRKDISLPNPELEKLFGSWKWVSTTCGWTGTSSASCDLIIEFNKNGIYKKYESGDETKKMKFTLTQGKSIYGSGIADFVNFKDVGLIKKKGETYSMSIKFSGQDTLFLNDNACDGCEIMYIRKE